MERKIHEGATVPIRPTARHVVREGLKNFFQFRPMNTKQKIMFRLFLLDVNLHTNREGDTYPGIKDVQAKLQSEAGRIIKPVDPQLAGDLNEFIQGMLFLSHKDQFFNQLRMVAETTLSPDRLPVVLRYLEHSDTQRRYMVYQILQDFNEDPQISQDRELHDALKSCVWKAVNQTLQAHRRRKDFHTLVNTGDKLVAHNASKATIRSRFAENERAIEEWRFRSGNYSNVNITAYGKDDPAWKGYKPQDEELPDERSYERVNSAEAFMVQRIRQELRAKKHRPVVFVDFGSQLAYSTLKLATLFEREVREGEVMFVATNQFDDRSKIEKQYEGDRRRTFFSKTSALVHFVQADAQDLQDLKVTNPFTGEVISLKGNVSLIHELGSIGRHGGLNDIDYPLLANTLHEDGVLMTARFDDGHGNSPIDSQVEQRLIDSRKEAGGLIRASEDRTYTILSRKWGFQQPIKRASDYQDADRAVQASRNLHEAGFRVLDHYVNRQLNYAFWMRTSGLPIQLQDLTGEWADVPPSVWQ